MHSGLVRTICEEDALLLQKKHHAFGSESRSRSESGSGERPGADVRSCSFLLYTSDFYPRDAMLARVLAMTLCPSAFVCQTSVFYRNGRTNRAGFGTGASFDLSYTAL